LGAAWLRLSANGRSRLSCASTSAPVPAAGAGAATAGAHIISFDKAPLDPSLVGLAGIEYRRESAFAPDPLTIGPVDWLFSDVVCYPKRLLTLVQRWLAAGTVRCFVCTVKFRERLTSMPCRLRGHPDHGFLHLHNNKHELTKQTGLIRTDAHAAARSQARLA
jgi:hypothetical protein